MTDAPQATGATDTTVRAMTLEDCPAVAAVRVCGWRFAYEGLMPRAHLEAMSVDADTERRREQFLAGAGRVVNLVAERAGRVIGWGCYGPSRDTGVPGGTAELYALYVLPEHLSRGVGRALTAELLDRAAAAGHPLMQLWVVAGNARARRFYARAGFAPDGAEEPYDVAGVEVPEVRYARALSAPPAAADSRG
ncbi:GNAT family N-acetyltransferase [Streptomyces sp. NBC_01497]|uniref:GNAT family N-acetyltransferase n=1 Tax=Streptomyces sp. NBC_01497 TaxID=2903885 RepID=UPI002E37CAA2|nr:GNAT family N-acetyltransferase [Streptomyces sp. NBC_01497]